MALVRVTRGIPKYNIQIGALDKALEHNPDVIVSVTDAFEPSLMSSGFVKDGTRSIPFYWVPVLEMGRSWGYKPFYAFKRIMDTLTACETKPFIYVCCSAGQHRSPVMTLCWLLSLEMTLPQANKLFHGNFSAEPLTKYKHGRDKGNIPPDLGWLYGEMRKHPTFSYQGIIQSMGLQERITYTGGDQVRVDGSTPWFDVKGEKA